MQSKAVTDVLARKGVELGDSVELSTEVSFYHVAGGRDALKLWFGLARELPQVGTWPVLCSDDAAIGYLRRCGKAAGEVSTAEILSRTGSGEGASKTDLERISARLFRKALPAGLLDDSNKPLERCYLGVMPARSAYELPVFLRFGGVGNCPGPEVHAARLRDWGRRFGAMPLVLKHSMFECVVARPPMTAEEAMQLAREQAEYCPDVVRRGLGTVEKLSAALVGLPYWAFWWD